MIEAPHVDPRVLHAPGECDDCDRRPDLQQLRQTWEIAFTGHPPTTNKFGVQQALCPADAWSYAFTGLTRTT